MSFKAPVQEMLFVLEHIAGLPAVAALPGFDDDNGLETAAAVLGECARLNEEVIAPLNREGDLRPATLADGVVTTTPGFVRAFRQYCEGGWQGVQHPVEFGGQGLPKLIATPCIEMLNAANLSFALCPLLTDGAIEALLVAGTPEQRERYLPRLIDGSWTGTMNLTEPQAGSDLAMIRSRAEPQADGTWRIFGQKIFITYGEHDMAENIVHLVLARTPDAPAGVKGISLFIVPKYVLDEAGTPGARNDVWCQSIEHKLGIQASPTAVLVYGDDQGAVGPGAIGYMVGEENRGLEYMFVMMNSARFAVGMQGVAVAERASQHAANYARERVQGREVTGSPDAVPIIRHPDVRRMLMSMRALTEGARALAYVAAAHADRARRETDPDARRQAAAEYEFLVPIVKGWSTEMAVEVGSLGVQVHGGMGFIEETGAAQFYRDARILPIYEGTTAIQANDLIGRKTARDGGAVALSMVAQLRETAASLGKSTDERLLAMAEPLARAAAGLETTIGTIVASFRADPLAAYSASVPYLKQAGLALSAWQLARGALAAEAITGEEGTDRAFLDNRINVARFFAEHLLPHAAAHAEAVAAGAASTMALPDSAF